MMKAVAMILMAAVSGSAAIPREQMTPQQKAVHDCAPITIESIRVDCEKRLLAAMGVHDCNSPAGGFYAARHTVDKITDSRQCTVSAQNAGLKGGIYVGVIDGRLHFGVMGDKFPGEDMAIRVDSNRAYVFEEFVRGDQAKALLSEIRAGREITTRFSEWPQHVNRDHTYPVCNLAAAIDDCLDGP